MTIKLALNIQTSAFSSQNYMLIFFWILVIICMYSTMSKIVFNSVNTLNWNYLSPGRRMDHSPKTPNRTRCTKLTRDTKLTQRTKPDLPVWSSCCPNGFGTVVGVTVTSNSSNARVRGHVTPQDGKKNSKTGKMFQTCSFQWKGYQTTPYLELVININMAHNITQTNMIKQFLKKEITVSGTILQQKSMWIQL